ncbi:cytochrome P450 81Q32-like [Cannabis sativa]|uniref:cytochrome P450 81Q32-like n=1 Tax=Cannabis sativa TaxID=3483 RepID=UPI0029CA4791|nr:cytochrome P450 81Q32-like [Cannabis sativa]
MQHYRKHSRSRKTMKEESVLLYTTLSLIIVVLLSKLLFQTKKRQYKKLPPSPPSLPLIGHLHLIKQPVHRFFRDLSHKYGTVLSLWFGPHRVVIISSRSAAEECFTKNDIVLANRTQSLIGKHVSYNHTTVVASSYGDHWRNLRRIGSIEIFSASRLKSHLDTRKDEIKRMICKLAENSLRESDNNNEFGFAKVEMKTMFSNLAFNIIMRMVAGKRYCGDDVSDEEEALQFRRIREEVIPSGGVANSADFLPWALSWVGKGYERKVKRAAKRMDSFMQGLVDERRSMKADSTMIDHMLALQLSDPQYYTDEIIKGFIVVLLVAGSDTSSVTLEWALSNLVNHPHILKKVKAEIDEQIGEHKLIDEPDLSKLPYLQNIISETLRLFPAAPMLLPHLSSKDCTIEGYDIPRETIVFVNVWAIHRDPTLWKDPESFNPERFESREHQSNVNLLMPFGLGRRSCPGNGMALRVIGLTLGTLIQCFEWEKVSDEKIDMTEGRGITMPKFVPLQVLCKARPIMNLVLSQ